MTTPLSPLQFFSSKISQKDYYFLNNTTTILTQRGDLCYKIKIKETPKEILKSLDARNTKPAFDYI